MPRSPQATPGANISGSGMDLDYSERQPECLAWFFRRLALQA
jgi:hypothetical protein